MAVDYRFSGTNIDVTLVTDAPLGAKTFFVTELRGYDPADIMAGINVGIEEYHEAAFVKIGSDNSLQLDRIDRNGTSCLVVPAAAAGRFNGSTSVLKVADVTLASSNVPQWPITIGLTWRMTAEDFAALDGSCPPFYLIGSDLSDMSRFEMHLSPGPINEQGDNATVLAFNMDIGGSRVVDLIWRSPFGIQDMCVETEVRFTTDNSRVEAALYVNGEEQDSAFFSTSNFDMNDFDIAYGAQQTNQSGGISYQGIMRDLLITSSAGTLVEIIDPSTGTNTGSEANGVPTDITSVSIIT